MGAAKPQPEKPKTRIHSLFSLLLVGSVLLLVGLFSGSITFEWLKDEPKLSRQEEAKLQKRLKEIDDSEQYALTATVDGWYTCLHSGRKTYYLKAGEVWKYGITSKGELGRYSRAFLANNRVSYIVQFKGNYAECLKQEQIQLFNYPFLPENLARSPADALSRPPYNPVMR